LNEAATIADQDEQQQRVNKQMHNQRIASIELMAASIVVPELQHAPNEELRNKIINIFFKLMASRQKPTVQAAKKGLEQVLTWPNGVPKDVLSSSLKNILTNLSDYRKLSEPVLEGILRLLAMLTKCFNVALGGTYQRFVALFPPLTQACRQNFGTLGQMAETSRSQQKPYLEARRGN